MEYVTLNNGVKMPKLGYGVYPVSYTHLYQAPDPYIHNFSSREVRLM